MAAGGAGGVAGRAGGRLALAAAGPRWKDYNHFRRNYNSHALGWLMLYMGRNLSTLPFVRRTLISEDRAPPPFARFCFLS
ncbi:hypothetical protein JZ751_022142 [Albula glossodonta]|uniref:Uncharacterized protein n=1 Tax=Albula glossodonta TaxID=121402 RepID=A0A8T2NLW9_9TELE|nr:hypothetical protein JZ751_022142 [Albula glossodonta]